MSTYNEKFGNIITMAHEGDFDVIAHGCNCHNAQGSGLAPQMVEAFKTNTFKMERPEFKGDINKLGQIDYELQHFSGWDQKFQTYPDQGDTIEHSLYVVNAYTQYRYGRNHADGDIKPVDYEAITLCMRKLNSIFKGSHIGLPLIGCGLAGGDWDVVKRIIQSELKDCDVTVVIYRP